MSQDSSLRGCEALSRGNPVRSGSPRLNASQPRDDDRKMATSKRRRRVGRAQRAHQSLSKEV